MKAAIGQLRDVQFIPHDGGETTIGTAVHNTSCMCAEQGRSAKTSTMKNRAGGDVPWEAGELCAHKPESHEIRQNDAFEKFVLNDLCWEIQ